MAGELNGTKALVMKGVTEIVGQMEMSVAFNGTPIDISNKSQGDWVTLLDGELAGKQLQISGTILYSSDTVYRAVRADALTGAQAAYSVVYGTTGESFAANFVPNGLSDALPMGDKVSTSITLLSSGVVTHTAAT